MAGGILLACETAWLVAAGAPLWSSSSQGLGPTPAVVSLQKAVGTSLVGLGTESCVASELFGAPVFGILPEANDVFRIHQLAIYDPIAPIADHTVWRKVTGQAGGIPISNSSVPSSSPSLSLGSSEWPMSSKLAAPKVQLAVCLSKRWVTRRCTESPMLHRPQFRRLRPASRCPQTQRMELQSPFNIPTPGRGALLPTPRLPRSSDYVLPMFRVGTPRSMVGLWPSSSFQG